LNWADQLLDALDYLHTQEPSVIHRDIKPQNLKLTPRNAIVLLDFGLAKGTPTQAKVTATGSVFGYSRFYAPLEQIQGAGTDPRSDLYSLAATLYHLMTGVTPAEALLRATAVLNGHPDPLLPANEVHEQVTPAVAEVISRAMSQNAAQRPQTASAMREALREAARQGHSTIRDTNALPAPSSNVYEQDTKLMFSAALSTNAGEVAEETGTMRADGSATAINSTPAASASASTANPDSVVTKVAKAEPTTLKNQPRRRALAIAASAAVLIAVAAAVYTFTNTAPPTPSSQENTQSAPTLPATSNTDNQSNQQAAEDANQFPATPAASPQGMPPASTPPARQTKKIIIQSGPMPKPGPTVDEEGDNNDVPEPPPDTDETVPPPQRRPRKILRPANPQLEEALRAAEEARRAGDEARRAAREQRRLMLLKQRQQIIERERRRRQQMP
jgi:serine/threonine protein kinase